MKKMGMILACAALLVSLFTAGALASGDMAGSSGELETASLTEDLTLEAGVYEENIEANGYRVTLLEGAELSGAITDGELVMEAGSKWTGTGTSSLTYLETANGADAAGSQGKAATMTNDGIIAVLAAGNTYEGDITVYSGDASYPFYITITPDGTEFAEDADAAFSGELTENSLSSFSYASLTHGLLDLSGRTEEPFVLGGKGQNIPASDLDILPEAQGKLDLEYFDRLVTGWTAPAISITGSAYAVIENVYIRNRL